MKSGRTAVPVVAAMLLLSACGKQEKEPWVPQQTALQIAKEGVVTETIIDSLDQDYYSSSELEKMVRSSVAEYAGTNGADSLQLTEYTSEGRNVRIVLTYGDDGDYAAFNSVPFYNGSMLGAQMEGFRFDTEFLKVGKDGTASGRRYPSEEPVSHKEYNVLICDREHVVEVPGDVVYVSAPAVVQDARIVTPGASEMTEGDAQLLYVLYEF